MEIIINPMPLQRSLRDIEHSVIKKFCSLQFCRLSLGHSSAVAISVIQICSRAELANAMRNEAATTTTIWPKWKTTKKKKQKELYGQMHGCMLGYQIALDMQSKRSYFCKYMRILACNDIMGHDSVHDSFAKKLRRRESISTSSVIILIGHRTCLCLSFTHTHHTMTAAPAHMHSFI